ncbi:hypothetical protein AS25_05775 [Kocuria marina]|uniref:Uncharacterized protein n=1 Tax=Kocuria marina TaxID=223184 RepID=A0A0B0D9H7_9MICC|nr:hypothetical protein AS25_05775 [Kocuria marina]
MTPVTANALLGAHVPACQDCNAVLNTTVEKPAKPVVRRLLEHGDSGDELILSADECVALARWLLKVGLLSAHPAADHDHPGLQSDQDLPRLPVVRPEWLDWMRAGGEPPAGFSVFVTRRNLRGEDAAPAVKQHIVLPQLIVDGEDRNFTSQSIGFAGVNATIVWHPGWPIAHAQVGTRRAARLWPDPYEVDFGTLPKVHPRELAFRDGAAVVVDSADELAQFAQHPLSVDYDPSVAFFGVVLPSEE